MRSKVFFIAFLAALPLAAQTDTTDLSGYQGPGVLSPGVGEIGLASGRGVDLRFYGGIGGVYDTNVQPVVTDAQGNLVHVPDLFGIVYNAGAYGSHTWQHSKLALSYAGDYREYVNHSTYNGTNQTLTIGYTMQPSSRVVIDTRISGYVLNQSGGLVADTVIAQGGASTIPLFDTRTYQGSGTASLTYLASARDSFTFGGGGGALRYQSDKLAEYSNSFANASYLRRVTARQSLGVIYSFLYQTSATGSFAMMAHTVSGQYAGEIGGGWVMNLSAGTSFTHTHQLVAFALDPDLATLLGTPSIIFPSDTQNIFPTGSLEIRRQYRRTLVYGYGNVSVGGGNGLALTSRNQGVRAGVSYTGIRKWNFGADGSYTNFTGFGGTGDLKLSWWGGGGGFTYEIMRYVHIVARLDYNHYDVGGLSSIRRNTERATLGISFTTKDVPLALW